MPGTKLVQLVPFGGRKEIHIQQQAGKRCTFKVCPEREGVGGAIHWPLVFSISFCFLDPREAGNLAYTKGNLKTFFEIKVWNALEGRLKGLLHLYIRG